jgi:hypothetical protein
VRVTSAQWRTAAAIVAALAALACGGDPTAPDRTAPVERDYLRFTYQGAATGAFEARGVAPLPIDHTRDWTMLSRGVVSNGFISIDAVTLLANRGSSTSGNGGFDDVLVYLHPTVDRSGRYEPGACPEPQFFGGCFRFAYRLGVLVRQSPDNATLVTTDATLQSAQDVTLEITEYSPTHVRGTFTGRFLYRHDGTEAPQTVTIADGAFDVKRRQ